MARPIRLLETLHNDPSPTKCLSFEKVRAKQTGKRHKLVDRWNTSGFD